jgi:hypothetical protein
METIQRYWNERSVNVAISFGDAGRDSAFGHTGMVAPLQVFVRQDRFVFGAAETFA